MNGACSFNISQVFNSVAAGAQYLLQCLRLLANAHQSIIEMLFRGPDVDIQCLQVLPLQVMQMSVGVPLVDLHTQKDTDNDNDYVESNREPVLCSNMLHEAAQDQEDPPSGIAGILTVNEISSL